MDNKDADSLENKIKNLFSQKDEVAPEPKPKQTKSKKIKAPKLKSVEALSEAEMQKLTQLGLDQMEDIRQHFLTFQDRAAKCPIYKYFNPEVFALSQVFQDVVDLLEMNINPDTLPDEESKVRYNKLQLKKTEILKTIKDAGEEV